MANGFCISNSIWKKSSAVLLFVPGRVLGSLILSSLGKGIAESGRNQQAVEVHFANNVAVFLVKPVKLRP